MAAIYHIVQRSDWEQTPTQPYRAASLATEGFIHCSRAEQVAWVANSFYRDLPDLVLLEIDPERLSSAVRVEQAPHGEWFPHVYGPIERAAVVRVHELQRDGAGNWMFPPGK